MEYLTVTELKNNMKLLMNRVEAGECFTVTKKGKPIVKLEPFKKSEETPVWKRPRKLLKMDGDFDSVEIISEMRDERMK